MQLYFVLAALPLLLHTSLTHPALDRTVSATDSMALSRRANLATRPVSARGATAFATRPGVRCVVSGNRCVHAWSAGGLVQDQQPPDLLPLPLQGPHGPPVHLQYVGIGIDA